MIKTISKIALVALLAASFTACNKEVKPADEELDTRCRRGTPLVLVPKWVCIPSVEGADYVAVGSGASSNESMRSSKAMGRARAELAQQVETKVKAKLTDFMRSTGNGDSETLDSVTTTVTKQTAKLNLSGSRKVDEYTTPTGTMYVLIAIDDTIVNKTVKDKVKTMSSSHNNENALWQQFQSKQALDELDKEFPTD